MLKEKAYELKMKMVEAIEHCLRNDIAFMANFDESDDHSYFMIQDEVKVIHTTYLNNSKFNSVMNEALNTEGKWAI